MKTFDPIIPLNSPLRRACLAERPRRLAPVAVVLAGHLVLFAVLAVRGSFREGSVAWRATSSVRSATRSEALQLQRFSGEGAAMPVPREGPVLFPQRVPEWNAQASLVLPTGCAIESQLPAPIELPSPSSNALPESPCPPGSVAYTVKPGDTLSRIARAHGTSVRALRSANRMRTDFLTVGQKLRLPD